MLVISQLRLPYYPSASSTDCIVWGLLLISRCSTIFHILPAYFHFSGVVWAAWAVHLCWRHPGGCDQFLRSYYPQLQSWQIQQCHGLIACSSRLRCLSSALYGKPFQHFSIGSHIGLHIELGYWTPSQQHFFSAWVEGLVQPCGVCFFVLLCLGILSLLFKCNVYINSLIMSYNLFWSYSPCTPLLPLTPRSVPHVLSLFNSFSLIINIISIYIQICKCNLSIQCHSNVCFYFNFIHFYLIKT